MLHYTLQSPQPDEQISSKNMFSAQTFASPTRSQGRLLQFCVNLVAKQNWCLQS